MPKVLDKNSCFYLYFNKCLTKKRLRKSTKKKPIVEERLLFASDDVLMLNHDYFMKNISKCILE